MPKFVEMGQAVTLGNQLKSEEGPVVLINTFVASPRMPTGCSKSGRAMPA